MGLAAPLLRHRLRLPRPVVSVLAWQAPLAVVLARPRSRGRDAQVYALQMAAYIAHYEMPNDDPGRLRRRLLVTYPIAPDRALGGGELPTVRLQRALSRPGEVAPHDLVLSFVHWMWFAMPHASLAYILWRHPERFPRSACLMAGVFDLGLIGYWAVPTAPPWWAAAHGAIPPVRRVAASAVAPALFTEGGATPQVRRIMVDAGKGFWGRMWHPLYDALGANPFAAMPSLHFATSIMAARVLSETGRLPGAVGWAYALTLGFALVYLGEHYVLDLVAGLALCEGVRRLGPRAEPVVRAVGRAVARLERRLA